MTEINQNDSGCLLTIEKRRAETSDSASPPLFGKPVWDAEQHQLRIEIGALSGSPSTVILTCWERGITVALLINGEIERKRPINHVYIPKSKGVKIVST